MEESVPSNPMVLPVFLAALEKKKHRATVAVAMTRMITPAVAGKNMAPAAMVTRATAEGTENEEIERFG